MKQASGNKTRSQKMGKEEGSHTFRNHNHTQMPRDDAREKTRARMSLSKYILNVC